MEDKEVEYLIDKKVAEAKLEVSEKRNQFLLWFFGIMLTIVGVAIPLLQSNRSSDKVDESVSVMKNELKEAQSQYDQRNIDNERNFKESVKEISAQQNSALTTISNNTAKTIKEIKEEAQRVLGQSLSKPDLTILYDNEEINGKTIKVKYVENGAQFYLQLKNIGEVRAEKISILLYNKSNMQDLFLDGWDLREVCEEEGYVSSYEYRSDLVNIDPQMSKTINFSFGYRDKVKPRKEDLLLKIFSGLPKPKEIKFSVVPL